MARWIVGNGVIIVCMFINEDDGVLWSVYPEWSLVMEVII